MLTVDEVEQIVRRALAPLETEIRNLQTAVLSLDEPATEQQVERIVEETVLTAVAPVIEGLAQLGARVRPVRTRGQRAAAKVIAAAARSLRPPPRSEGEPRQAKTTGASIRKRPR